MAPNPLISTTKSSDSSLHAALHPLVLLTISDYITRHSLRKLKQPIVGALIGQQNGREITIEHAYDLMIVPSKQSDGGFVLHEEYFRERLQQYKDVHKEPALDLVGWWTISPSSGPGPEILGIQRQVMEHNESALLLTFHPDDILDKTATGGKLPLTIYESVYENVNSLDAGGDEAMKVEGQDDGTGERLELRLKELGYEIATGEAEMISVDFVARGGGNATAINHGPNPHGKRAETNAKGKEKEVASREQLNLNSEEEELLSFLTSRANAIKMLHSRISALKNHLTNLPPSYITTDSPPDPSEPIDHVIPRSILSLVAKLPLVVPGDIAAFDEAQAAERSNVELVQLLGGMGRNIQQTRELGSKFAMLESGKKSALADMGPLGIGGMMAMSGLDPALGGHDEWTDDVMQQ